ncbi:MAG: serine hydrolase domain-containing protein [Planctomycetaceae bacterium]
MFARVLCFTAALFAQQERPPVFDVVDPASVQLDAEKLQKIDKYMREKVADGSIVGCSGLIARGQKVAYFQTWGDMNREKQQPMRADTIFRIYSMSKPITSVAAMQLVERGKMKLDDPVSKYLPALKDMKVLKGDESVPAETPISVRHLMSHQAGFTYGFFGNSKVDQAYRKAGVLMTGANVEDTVGKLGSIPLQYEPGTRWHYSVATDVLGRLVEVVSGERFDVYLENNIFKPLNMVDTSFVVPADKLDRFAEMYRERNSELKPANRFSSRRFIDPKNTYFSGGGGLCSTTRDYLRFCQALLAGGELDGARILKASSIKQMTTNQLKTPGFKFGLGFSITSEGEYSWGGAAGTRFYINPKRNLIGIYMIQINPYGSRKHGGVMKRLTYEADLGSSVPGTEPTAPMP